jgi:S-DNA-T family DNA segregation ATPase FtsK/SpoIIIE
MCSKKFCPGDEAHFLVPVFGLIPLAAAVAGVLLLSHRTAGVIYGGVIVLLALTAVAVRLAVVVVRFVRLSRAGKRNWFRARWCRWRWRWLCANLALSYLDKHRPKAKPIPFGTSVKVAPGQPPAARLRFPRARFYATEFGVEARMRLIPNVSREDVEASAVYIADAWRCHRVRVTQTKPGRLTVRGLTREPLAEPLSAARLPAFDGRHVVLGRDEWGQLRRADLANHAGSCWAGNPGRGKTESALSLAVQLAPSPLVDFWIMDGGACDWSHFAHGAAGYVDDDLEAAEDMLHTLELKMRARRRTLEADLGVRNAWLKGPAPDYRLQWLLVEEAPFYLSMDAVKGDKEREKRVLACRGKIAQLLRRGRAPMFHTSLMGQKITTSSIPPDLRDLCGLRWSFGTSTIEGAVAALGDDIRHYPTMQPQLLQAPEYVGVASALLPTGQSPYTLIKFPKVGEELADQVAEDLALRPAQAVLAAAGAR